MDSHTVTIKKLLMDSHTVTIKINIF